MNKPLVIKDHSTIVVLKCCGREYKMFVGRDDLKVPALGGLQHAFSSKFRSC